LRRALTPVIEKVAAEFKGRVKLVKVNTRLRFANTHHIARRTD
jgi:thioredoxin-like negative regulator of GroEL